MYKIIIKTEVSRSPLAAAIVQQQIDRQTYVEAKLQNKIIKYITIDTHTTHTNYYYIIHIFICRVVMFGITKRSFSDFVSDYSYNCSILRKLNKNLTFTADLHPTSFSCSLKHKIPDNYRCNLIFSVCFLSSLHFL